MFPDLDAFFNGLATLWRMFMPVHAIPPALWAEWEASASALCGGLRQLWSGEDEWTALEERCRHLGVLFAGLLVSVAVWRCDQRAVPGCCPVCQKRASWRWRTRELLTSCGRVLVARREVRCRRCRYFAARYPADLALGLPAHDHVSPALAVWSAKLGASLPYAVVARLLHDWTGQAVASAKGIHDHTRRLGAALSEVPDVAPATTLGTLPERVVVDADAAVVGLHKTAKSTPKDLRFELWAGRVYERHERGYGGEHLYRHLAFGGGCNRAGDDVATGLAGLAARRFPHALPERTVYVRGDGGQLLDTLAGRFPRSRRLLDLYHTLVKLSERVKEAFPDLRFAARKALADPLEASLRAGEVVPLLAGLDALAGHPACATREPLERLAKHLRKHADHLWYPEAEALGLGVGTAIAEKDVDLLLDRRFELRGMSWSPKGARDNLRVRLTLFNHTEDRLALAAR